MIANVYVKRVILQSAIVLYLSITSLKNITNIPKYGFWRRTESIKNWEKQAQFYLEIMQIIQHHSYAIAAIVKTLFTHVMNESNSPENNEIHTISKYGASFTAPTWAL